MPNMLLNNKHAQTHLAVAQLDCNQDGGNLTASKNYENIPQQTAKVGSLRVQFLASSYLLVATRFLCLGKL